MRGRRTKSKPPRWRRAVSSVRLVALIAAAAVVGGFMPLLVSSSAVATTPATGAVMPAAAANPTSGNWTGTWATAPQSGGSSFNQQTIRQIVRTSISGTVARLQLSNAFGTTPLTVRDVHLADAGSGSSIVSGTDHTVTFGGSSSVTIPAGGLSLIHI